MKLFVLDKLDFNDLSPEDLDYIDFEVFYNIAWALAKTADRNIPDPITWLDGFDTFPIFEIIPEIQDMITSSIDAKKKKQKTKERLNRLQRKRSLFYVVNAEYLYLI